MRTTSLTLALLALSAIAHAMPPSQREISARVGDANRQAEAAMERVRLTPNLEGADTLATAVAPSIATFDDVIALDDPYASIVAEDAKRALYERMAVRMRSTVRAGNVNDHIIVETLIANWLDNASLASARVADLVKAHPKMARTNPVISRIARRPATQVGSR